MARQDGYYISPDGRPVAVTSNMGVLFSDDFGGAAVLADRWQVIDGGQQAVTLGNGTVQAAIGSGTTGITDSVSGSQLVVAMGTTNGAERWYLSTRMFAGSEDVTVLITKSQANANNSIFIGLVEVEPSTGLPLLNPNLAGDFTNRGGVEFGKSATATAYHCEAVADSSGAVATGTAGTAIQTFASGVEATIEFHAEDIIGSTCVPDSIAGRATTPARVSTQCPNDGRVYKLLMRFQNVGVPTATTVSIDRVLVVDCQEYRVEVSSGRGDTNAQKGLPVNIVGGMSLSASTAIIGLVNPTPVTAAGASTGLTAYKYISAATTNSGVVKASFAHFFGGIVTNTAAAFRYLKIYNKATAPTVGTDTPILTFGIPPGQTVNLNMGDLSIYCSAGIGHGITTAAADADTGATAANDVVLDLFYT